MEFYNNIAENLSKKNVNLAVGNMYDYMAIWKKWYSGDVAEFHHYKEVVAGTTKAFERLTMNMAKKNCEDIAKLLWTEKTQINIGSEANNKKLWEILDSKKNSFTINFPIFLEKACALGTGALIEYKDENDETVIDYVNGDVVIPYKYTNSYINGIITVSRFQEVIRNKNYYYTHITYHEFDGKKYTILHELYKSANINELGKEVDFSTKFPNVKESDEIETETPRFQVFGPNLANNIDMESPLKPSILANSIDRYKSLDMKYDSFFREFKLGKKRILVDPTAMKKSISADENGNVKQIQYFDANDEAFIGINGMEDQPVKDIDFSLRAQEHIDSINADLNWLSSNLGLGSNFYKFDGNSVKTATEVMSENSEAFRTKTHYDIVVNDVIYDLVKVICEMEGIDYKDISIIADDSIIEDKNAKELRAMQEVAQGLKSKKSYLKEKGLTDDEIEKELKQIKDEKMSNEEAFGFNVGDE